jgi:hypothetical protein
MKAYHVYIIRNREPETFELITHMYSCINHRNVNPDVPLSLITDSKTKEFYDKWKITSLYDEVITNFFDDYPYDRISHNFWASPKIWAMGKLKAPFIILDTDLLLHNPLSTYTNCDLAYLHRETSVSYPNIFDVHGPEGFVWDDDMLKSFRNTQPMNCAVIGMFNDSFKSDFVKRYFDFVLDSSGDVSYATEHSHRMQPLSSAQIMMEQWFIAALANYWTYVLNVPIKTQAVCKVLYSSEGFFTYDMDMGHDVASPELNNTLYHLWGAKQYQNDKTHELHISTRDMLYGGKHLVESSSYYNILKEPFDKLLTDLFN